MEKVELKEKIANLPTRPGVYLMKDKWGEIIYVGKAVSLRNRVRSYFQSSQNHSPKVRALVDHIADLDYIVTESELEALILECNLIKQYRPKYNINLKDDKNYPYLKITVQEDYPRLLIVRSFKKDGAKYYGPYADVGAVKHTINTLKRIFPLRSCKKILKEGEQVKDRPCLNFHLKQCLAPCQGDVNKETYRQMIEEICLFLEGKQDDLIKKLTKEMEQAAEELRFERAAELRNQIEALKKIMEKQRVISTALEDQDVVAFAQGDDDTCVQVFFIRGGKLIGKKHFILNGTGGQDQGEILSSFIKQFYTDVEFIPREILLQQEFDEVRIIEEWLSSRRGAKVYLRVPKRGEKHKLVEMVQENALLVLNELRQQQLKEETKLKQALQELKDYLQLPVLPKRIECYDISNIQGAEPVGSMVVFCGGEPYKEGYRRFKIKTIQGPNDFAMMAEVIRRRFQRARQEKEIQLGDDVKQKLKFAILPDLIIVDGGKGQLSAAREVMKELGFAKIPTFGLAKEEELLFKEGSPEPIVLPRDSQALYLLQRIRDEAHRFAITFHRQLRAKRMISSELDQIEGIGEKRRQALLRRFGSLAQIKQATIEELAAVEGMNKKIAERVYSYFH
ncbi:MAG TPA: excinuclease ABC subunit UvrC [Clostridia bacterium]|nr:excinuclease ABC subunit UvrC [Clostridia bacterium]